ncbi:transglutaminase-like domain-containing protein [Metabacillus bambusae]|uniref:Transglutaminase family protein n=1 Tax=Metabacillus bambusae TaxID=2795218 RepID=A0ABS3N929_9BACI|nr:transglutaminase family protein [Metabacillus bambusae]MBO1514655.1 transglutaminase family protein [Metabacillus bambusae]
MPLMCESLMLDDYLQELPEVDYSHPLLKEKSKELFHPGFSDIEKVKVAFEFVRDEIAHSWDIQSSIVTCKASEVLFTSEGICYAKSNLLAALLRSQGIPTGFCYQRLLLFTKPDDGYCIHALNAVHLSSIDKWVRLDARGNKQGIESYFSIEKEQLAFSINEKLGEIDYPTIYTKPNKKTIAVLEKHTNTLNMYKYNLPDLL